MGVPGGSTRLNSVAEAEAYIKRIRGFGQIYAQTTANARRGLDTGLVQARSVTESALTLAKWLETRDEVARVLHPALPSFPGHELWKRDFTGASGIFSFVLKAESPDRFKAKAHAFLDALRLFGLGYSWGGFESLATFESPQLAFRRHPPELPGALIRLHVGLEDPADLIADLDQAFARAAG